MFPLNTVQRIQNGITNPSVAVEISFDQSLLAVFDKAQDYFTVPDVQAVIISYHRGHILSLEEGTVTFSEQRQHVGYYYYIAWSSTTSIAA